MLFKKTREIATGNSLPTAELILYSVHNWWVVPFKKTQYARDQSHNDGLRLESGLLVYRKVVLEMEGLYGYEYEIWNHCRRLQLAVMTIIQREQTLVVLANIPAMNVDCGSTVDYPKTFVNI